MTPLEIAGRRVEVLALPLIFDMFRQAGKRPGAGTAVELMDTVRMYNRVPDEEQASWNEVIQREYTAYFAGEAR